MVQRQSVRRTDVLLRAKYPHIQTRIFERGPRDHVIVVPREQLDAEAHRREFEREIQLVTDVVVLSNSIPEGAQEIAPIKDAELGANLSGLPLSVMNLRTIVAGRLPRAPWIIDAGPIGEGSIRVRHDKPTSPEIQTALRALLEELLDGYGLVLDVAETIDSVAQAKPPSDTLDVKPVRERSDVPDFIASDEQWWFENLPGIFDGTITPSSFDITHNAGFSCFIHGTAFPNIDIRQALLAYDTIYLEPPFADGRLEYAFWASQAIGPAELLKLIEAGRLRLVHSQPEERSDLGFLREAHEANPRAVFSRRKLAGLVIADAVETANEYVLGRPELQEPLRAVLDQMATDRGIPMRELASGILYPSFLRRAALPPFLTRGAMGLAGLNQGSHFAAAFKRIHGKETLIEAEMFGQAVHIAHVLNATYLPHGLEKDYVGSWLDPMRLFGDRLNFYRSFNTRIAASWAENERRKIEERSVILPPVPIVKFDKHASIDHILEYTSSPSDRRRGRALIGRLLDLPEQVRLDEVERLTKELFEKGLADERRGRSIQWLDAGSGFVAYAVGLNLPPIFAGAFLLKNLLETARKLPKMNTLIDAIESALSPSSRPNEDLHLLSKISRVATLRDQMF